MELVTRTTTEKCKSRQKGKFDTLWEQSATAMRSQHLTDKWVINLSSRALSEVEKGVLAKGLKFAPAPKRIPVPEIVAAVEEGLKRSGSTQTQQARTRIAGLLVKSRPPPSNLHPAEQKALKELKADETIVIAPADKGNATVVMNLSDMTGRAESYWQMWARMRDSPGILHRPRKEG